MVGRSHWSHARGTRRRRGCVVLVCAAFVLAPLWWQHREGEIPLLDADDARVPSAGGGYDGSHQGGLANFVDDVDVGEATPPRVDEPEHEHEHEHDHGVPAVLAGRPPRDASPTAHRLAKLGIIDGWDLDPTLPRANGEFAVTAVRRRFPLSSVSLQPDASHDDGAADVVHGAGVHLDAHRLNARYLTRVVDPRRLLANFRVVAGLPPETVPDHPTETIAPYCDVGSGLSYAEHPGACWEAPDCELRGHFAGHYLSALAFVVAGAGDRPTSLSDPRASLSDDNAEFVTGHQSDVATACHAREMVDLFVDGLAVAQASKRTSAGYVSAFPEEVLDRQGAIGGAWAPYYTLHKIGQGLLDAHVVAGNAKALDVLEGLANAVLTRVRRLIQTRGASHWFKGALEYSKAAFGAESGGFNELAWRLYQLTGNGDYVTLAGLFDHPTFLGRMSAGGDGLEREHANFHEPIAMGAYSRYEITGDEESRRAFRNFIELLRDTRSYATAGTCDGERWQAPGRLERIIVSTETQETCTQVNFERLANAAVASFGEAEARDWADYSERASLHGPVGLQRKPGELLYTTPLGVGVSKGRSGHGWGRPDAAFWCCYGTGVEALARLGDGVFWRLEAGATVPGDDTSATTATDVVYIARVTTSASAVWDEKGVTVRVSVDPFNIGRPVQQEGGGDGGRRRGFFVSAVAITVDAEGRKEPTSIRVKLPRWASGRSHIALNDEHVRCGDGDSSSASKEDSDSGWCDVTRVWRKTDVVRASFPLIVRAEPLLGSESIPGFGTGSNQRLDGKGARHAIVAGPYVLAALGPGAWIADLGVEKPASRNDAGRPGRGGDFSGGFHAGASEISSDDVSLLETPDPTACDRVAFALAGGGDRTRYLAAVVARSDGTLPGDSTDGGGGVHRGGPYARAAAVFAEPDLEPTLEESKPGGSGFFYAPRTCDRASCAYAVADAPAVTWTRCAVSSTNGERGGGDGGGEGIARGGAFTLQPTTAPGLSLSLSLSRDGGASVVLEASTGEATKSPTRPLALKLEAVDGTLGTHRVVVNDGELKGYALCRDAGSALDSPDACADLHEKCPAWASQAACFANQGYMHAHCARSCGLCRPGGAVLVRPGGAGDGAECGVTIIREEGSRKSAGGGGGLLPWRPPRGSHVGRGPDPRWMPRVLLAPLYSLRDEVYTVYLRLAG